MDRLSPSTLRTLLAVIELAQDGPVTVRGICAKLGLSSHNAVYDPLNNLESAGLISREPYKGGTIRPTCTVQLFALSVEE